MEFEFSSAKVGFQRFTTRYTREVVDRLEIAEDRLKEIMCPFLTAIFSKFHDHKIMWLQILNILTELDCLCSLSIASGHSKHEHTRPTFRETGPNDPGYLCLKQMIHPQVAAQSKRDFIPNDTTLDPANSQSLLLVTGPNMGGKSTLLR